MSHPQSGPGVHPFGQMTAPPVGAGPSPGTPLPPAAPIAPTPQPDIDPQEPRFRDFNLPVSTTAELPGYQVGRLLGVVFGVATRPRDLAHHPDMAYITVLARQDAVEAMVQQAREAGADAVIGLSFDGGKLSEGVSEVTAYGTAVSLID